MHVDTRPDDKQKLVEEGLAFVKKTMAEIDDLLNNSKMDAARKAIELDISRRWLQYGWEMVRRYRCYGKPVDQVEMKMVALECGIDLEQSKESVSEKVREFARRRLDGSCSSQALRYVNEADDAAIKEKKWQAAHAKASYVVNSIPDAVIAPPTPTLPPPPKEPVVVRVPSYLLRRS